MEREPEQPQGGAPSGGKFTWPPRRIDVDAADRDFASQARRIGREEWGRRDREASTEHATSQHPRAEESAETTMPPSRGGAARSRPEIPAPPENSWSAFEHAWLGVTSEAWARRRLIVDVDMPGEVCWRCASPIGAHESTSQGCATCRDAKLPWERLVRLGAYEGELRDTIREVKFKRFSSLGVAMGADLGGALAVAIAQAGASAPIVLVPVAMPLLRRLRRGVDHTKAIAVGAMRELRSRGVDARVAHLLARRHRPSQLEVAPSQRYANAAGSFVTAWTVRARLWIARRGVALPFTGPIGPDFAGTIIVIDDVRTTGATMAAACRQVRRLTQRAKCPKARVWGAVVAVATHRGLELG